MIQISSEIREFNKKVNEYAKPDMNKRKYVSKATFDVWRNHTYHMGGTHIYLRKNCIPKNFSFLTNIELEKYTPNPLYHRNGSPSHHGWEYGRDVANIVFESTKLHYRDWAIFWSLGTCIAVGVIKKAST